MNLHDFLDVGFHEGGLDELARRIDAGADLEQRLGLLRETPLHVATRRRRLDAVTMLADRGAELDALNADGKTAYAHALRRTFDEVAEFLAARGADTTLPPSDRFARLVATGDLDAARAMLGDDPSLARTGKPEEDRLLADMAGRNDTAPVALLIDAGADLAAPALDGGSALHQAAWFGQPANARQLIDAGAPLHVRCEAHDLTPLGWAAHGSRYSGGADERIEHYLEIARMLIDAGGAPDPSTDAGRNDIAELFRDSGPPMHALLRDAGFEPTA